VKLAVPQAVQGYERVAFLLRRILFAFVEGEIKWREVRLSGWLRERLS
jgi:hypothetical protein